MGSSGMLWTWIIIAAFCLLLDFISTSFFFVWFTIGGIAAIIVQTLGGGIIAQIIAFIVATGVSFAVGYPVIKKYIHKKIPGTPTTEENYVGKVIVSKKYITDKGRIKLDGIYWSVENSGEPISIGEKFTITKIEKNKLIIKKLGE